MIYVYTDNAHGSVGKSLPAYSRKKISIDSPLYLFHDFSKVSKFPSLIIQKILKYYFKLI